MYHISLSFFWTISSTSRGSPTQVDKSDLEPLIFQSLPPHCWAYRHTRLHPLYKGCWGSILVLPACHASTLATELHFQPHSSFYNEHLQRVHIGKCSLTDLEEAAQSSISLVVHTLGQSKVKHWVPSS